MQLITSPCPHFHTLRLHFHAYFHAPSHTSVTLPPPQVRVDHRNGTLHFGGQQLESEKVRVHLSSLAGRLSKAVVMIDAPVVPEEEAARGARRLAAIKHAMEHSNEEHKLMNARKVTQGGAGGLGFTVRPRHGWGVPLWRD